ncbi:MAG TPA: porin family protein [Salinivirgaceae bacterium]|nr:porin family protein [Salinivirgaceae bacterium]
MKKLTLLIVLAGALSIANAQFFKYGIRVGASASQVKMSDLVEITKSVNGQDTTYLVNFASNTPLGFHGGFFAQISLAGVYIQPEFLFATTGGEVKVKTGKEAVDEFSKSAKQRNLRIDIPVIVGMKLGPARLGLGPVASFNLLNKDEVAGIVNEAINNEGQSQTAETKFRTAVWGAQLDAGVNIFGKIALDIKYEFGLSKIGDGLKIGGQEYKFSKRANQFILSVGYMF